MKALLKREDGLRLWVRMLCDGYINALFVKGLTGRGKSFKVDKYLEEFVGKERYKTHQGKITDGILYRVLYEDEMEGKITVFRDVSSPLKHESPLDILKAALETTGERRIHNRSYGRQSSDLPDSFIRTRPIIFEFNKGGISGDDVDAVFGRGHLVEVNPSMEEMCELMREIAVEDWEVEVTEYLIENKERIGFVAFNLRTQQKAFRLYEASVQYGSDWKNDLEELFKDMLPESVRLLRELSVNGAKRSDYVRHVAQRLGVTLRRAQMKVKEWEEDKEIVKEGTKVREV